MFILIDIASLELGGVKASLEAPVPSRSAQPHPMSQYKSRTVASENTSLPYHSIVFRYSLKIMLLCLARCASPIILIGVVYLVLDMDNDR